MADVIVIGGGIVGLAAAYELASAGARTLLADRSDIGRATSAGAGILAPATSRHESIDWFNFAAAAVDYYPALIDRLRADGATETGYARMEELIVAVSEDEDAAFAATSQRILDRQRARTTPAPDELHPIDSAAARALFPPIADLRAGLYYRGAARVDGRLLAAALRSAAIGRGLHMRHASADRLVIDGGSVRGAVIDGETIAADAVVIAGGAWSGAFSDQLGVRLPVQPQRGQIIHLSLPGTDTSRWPIISAFHGHYMVPWHDSRVVVGATREYCGFAPHTTAAGVREVLDEALRVAPGLADASIGEIRVGLRPGTPDNLPVLGAVPGIANVYLATGHGATGLQLGPYSGRQIAALALGRAPEMPLDAFSIARFG